VRGRNGACWRGERAAPFKRLLDSRRERMRNISAMGTDRPLSGWISLSGVLSPGQTVAAYAARGQRVKGACRATGCSRRVDIDPRTLAGEGYTKVHMTRLRDLWRCHRLDGCQLSFYDDRPDFPLRLGHLVGKPHVRLRARCRRDGCKYFRVWLVEQIITGLAARNVGDERTEVAAVGGLMKTPCPMCKRVNWAADVLWANTESVGWRVDPEGTFARVAKDA
jgi:hypothetical protein